jgi:hypothetical protein
MRVVLALLGLFYSTMYAYSYNDVLRDYEAKNFEKVCNEGAAFLIKNDKNEQILVAIGDACARIDAINPLGNVAKNLVSTKEYRESGSYFATLVLQKKLIYQFMNDSINLKELKLPRTNHVLSRVFEQLSKGNYEVVEKRIEIITPEMNYVLWLSDDDPKKVYIDENKDGKLVKRHWYL